MSVHWGDFYNILVSTGVTAVIIWQVTSVMPVTAVTGVCHLCPKFRHKKRIKISTRLTIYVKY